MTLAHAQAQKSSQAWSGIPATSGCMHPRSGSSVYLNERLVLWRALVIIFIVAGHVTSAASSPKASDPVRIAAIFSQTGIAATHNEPLISMVQLAVEDINQAGGVLKRPIQLIVLDNQSTPIGATIAAEEAVRLDVAAVVGAYMTIGKSSK